MCSGYAHGLVRETTLFQCDHEWKYEGIDAFHKIPNWPVINHGLLKYSSNCIRDVQPVITTDLSRRYASDPNHVPYWADPSHVFSPLE